MLVKALIAALVAIAVAAVVPAAGAATVKPAPSVKSHAAASHASVRGCITRVVLANQEGVDPDPDNDSDTDTDRDTDSDADGGAETDSGAETEPGTSDPGPYEHPTSDPDDLGECEQ